MYMLIVRQLDEAHVANVEHMAPKWLRLHGALAMAEARQEKQMAN
jgi:hypothetical protein